MAPELLLPAGSLKHMRYAFAYGADAVYAGLPRYSLRVRENRFDVETTREAIAEAHRLGKRFYLAVNLLAHNAKLRTFYDDLEPIVAAGPDALIMADPGLILMVRERWPEVPIHLSVQANTLNFAAVKFWQSVGIERVILSRELSLEEIAEIRQRCPDMELEVFVHGALCIAYSGRCLLSGYFNRRDPNQGACTNACRWEYRLYLEETTRPGALMPIEEDQHGTYLLNSKDLCAIEHLPRLIEIGVDSFKIEGRTKSHYYVARTAQAYRKAIDDTLAGRPLDLPTLKGWLEGLSNRGYTSGFLVRHRPEELQNYERGASRSSGQRFVGEVSAVEGEWALVEVKNKFHVGDRIEWISPRGNRTLVLEEMFGLEGEPLFEAPGSGFRVRLRLPGATPFDLIARYLPEREG